MVICNRAGSIQDCETCLHSSPHERIDWDSCDEAALCTQWQECSDGINSNGKVRCVDVDSRSGKQSIMDAPMKRKYGG